MLYVLWNKLVSSTRSLIWVQKSDDEDKWKREKERKIERLGFDKSSYHLSRWQFHDCCALTHKLKNIHGINVVGGEWLMHGILKRYGRTRNERRWCTYDILMIRISIRFSTREIPMCYNYSMYSISKTSCWGRRLFFEHEMDTHDSLKACSVLIFLADPHVADCKQFVFILPPNCTLYIYPFSCCQRSTKLYLS